MATLDNVRSVVFDFDYTLADSSEGVVDCVNSALRELRLPEAREDAIRATIGLSLGETLERVAGPENARHAERFTDMFISRADQVMADKTRLFDFASATVNTLKSQGVLLSIVSTKYRRRIEAVLKRDGLIDAFALIVGGEDVPIHKPDPTGLLRAIELSPCGKAETIYVGDSVTDAETATRADVPFVAVLSGVTNASAFDEYKLFDILPNVSALPSRITKRNPA